MIDLEIFTAQLEAVGIVDIYTSIVWERRYAEAGFFEICAPATPFNVALLSKGNIVVKPDSVESGKIEQIRIMCDSEGRETITVSGRFLSHILYGHVVQAEKKITGNAEAAMRELVETTVMNPESDDYLPLVRLGDLAGLETEVNAYCNYPDLNEYLSAVTNATGVMYRIRLDRIQRLMYFECYEGKDRTVEQTDNPQTVFCEQDDTLLGVQYDYDRSCEINSVVARYRGEYGEVVVDYNPNGKSGEDKRTLSIEGNCITTTDSNGNTELNRTATRQALQALAKERLVKVTENFTASVIGDGPEYKTDYDLGDKVTVRHVGWNKSLNSRIETVTETIDDRSISIIPMFGSPLPSIADILR